MNENFFFILQNFRVIFLFDEEKEEEEGRKISKAHHETQRENCFDNEEYYENRTRILISQYSSVRSSRPLKIEAKHVSIRIRLPYYSLFLPVSRFSRFSYPASLSFSLSLHFFPLSPPLPSPPPLSSPQFFPFHSAC